MPEPVSSIKDPRVVELRGLGSGAARRAAGLAVLEGRLLFEQVLAALWTIQERVEDEVCAGMSAEERGTLMALLRRVQENARGQLSRRN